MMRRIGLNLMFLDARPLSGPGVYTRELVESIAATRADYPDLEFIGYVQPCAVKHFSAAAAELLRPLEDLASRFRRVVFEQLSLPRRTRGDRVELLFSPAFVSPLWGAPHLVATIHDMYYEVVPTLISTSQRRYWRAMIPPTARVCDAIIAVSENTRRDVERHLPAARGKVTAIPLASRFPRTELVEPVPSEASRPYVLLVANVTANKNPAVVVVAVAQLAARGIPIRLVHVGADQFGYLADEARRHGIDDAVLRLGKVSDAHLRGLYAHAVCTVVASLYEGFGLPVLEAQALGSPLVCSNRASLPEVAGEGAILIDPIDANAITDAISFLYDRPDERAALVARGFANLDRFSWTKTAARTIDLFRQVLDQ